MALEYTWKITSLKKATNSSITNAIVRVEWDYKGTDEDGDFGVFHGVTDFDVNGIDMETFLPFENLTEEIVLGWVKNVVDGLYGFYEHMNGEINKQINDKKLTFDYVNDSNFPWSSVE